MWFEKEHNNYEANIANLHAQLEQALARKTSVFQQETVMYQQQINVFKT